MMKKVTYFLTVILAVALMSTSCDPTDDPIVPDTLETLYPEWSNLSWVSTNGLDASVVPAVYPRLDIIIIDNVATITQTVNDEGGYYQGTYSTIEIETVDGNSYITFSGGGIDANVTGTFYVDGDLIMFYTKGYTSISNEYGLR